MKLVYISLLILSVVSAISQESIIWFIISLMFIFTLMNFSKVWNHVFLMLLNLEFLSLIFIMAMAYLSFSFKMNIELFFLFFTFAVCEASLGIAILIFFSHLKGSESLYSLMKI